MSGGSRSHSGGGLEAVAFLRTRVRGLLGIVIDILTVSATKTAIEERSPSLTASQVSSLQHVLIAGFIAGGVVAAAVWIGPALACRRGRNWARITGTRLLGLATLDTLVGLTAPARRSGDPLGLHGPPPRRRP
jgi:hypothetical protein